MGVEGPYLRLTCDLCNACAEVDADPRFELDDKGIGTNDIDFAIEEAGWGYYQEGDRDLFLCPTCLEDKNRTIEKELNSRMFARLKYDRQTQVLKLQFTGGDVYKYSQVPLKEVEGLLSASSAAAYFNRHIRNSYRGVLSEWGD